ncbi:MAG: hypothetical protein AMJ43_05890 [Coxiella sp. DG_40]|nr:MAG: hypothetical protein AMJ43_05890 [Coxiella sp. DG_40]
MTKKKCSFSDFLSEEERNTYVNKLFNMHFIDVENNDVSLIDFIRFLAAIKSLSVIIKKICVIFSELLEPFIVISIKIFSRVWKDEYGYFLNAESEKDASKTLNLINEIYKINNIVKFPKSLIGLIRIKNKNDFLYLTKDKCLYLYSKSIDGSFKNKLGSLLFAHGNIILGTQKLSMSYNLHSSNKIDREIKRFLKKESLSKDFTPALKYICTKFLINKEQVAFKLNGKKQLELLYDKYDEKDVNKIFEDIGGNKILEDTCNKKKLTIIFEQIPSPNDILKIIIDNAKKSIDKGDLQVKQRMTNIPAVLMSSNFKDLVIDINDAILWAKRINIPISYQVNEEKINKMLKLIDSKVNKISTIEDIKYTISNISNIIKLSVEQYVVPKLLSDFKFIEKTNVINNERKDEGDLSMEHFVNLFKTYLPELNDKPIENYSLKGVRSLEKATSQGDINNAIKATHEKRRDATQRNKTADIPEGLLSRKVIKQIFVRITPDGWDSRFKNQNINGLSFAVAYQNRNRDYYDVAKVCDYLAREGVYKPNEILNLEKGQQIKKGTYVQIQKMRPGIY